MDLFTTDIKFLKGVGEHRAKLLQKLGVYTFNDLLELFPRDYILRDAKSSIGELEIGCRSSLTAEIVSIRETQHGRQRQLNVVLSDGEYNLLCTWFQYGTWLTDMIARGQKVWVSGMITTFRDQFQIVHPELEVLDKGEDTASFWHSRTVLPVYPLTDKLKIWQVRQMIYNIFRLYANDIEETLSDDILQKFGWLPRRISLQKIHFSTQPEQVAAYKTRYAFEELFYNQLMLAKVRRGHEDEQKGRVFELKKTYTTQLKNSLKFQLTSAQKRVIREIVEDMTSGYQMNRLLQGDVGSGKTIVTLFAMLIAVENGCQAVIMAPTEILAEQHFLSFTAFLAEMDIRIAMLKGGNYKGKKKTKEEIKSGDIQIIVGTHALLQKDVEFHKIGFVAVDEQHRFGVVQRSLIPAKGDNPDLLYMSATPIPRSLALTVYGDLTVSVIDEMPPGRKQIKTVWKGEGRRIDAYSHATAEVRDGRQIYIVCPLIEESEKSDLLAAETLYEDIKTTIMPGCRAELLHGRMKNKEKDEIMNRFKNHEFDVLVSTTVIEVGIDVPNATVMIIEHAERFGLAQLHQLRGRVGRGSAASFCYLVAYYPLTKVGKERLGTMVETNDGFVIAEKDLELRGPGEFFGTAQSGMDLFKHANIVRDRQLLIHARAVAGWVLDNDPELDSDDNQVIKKTYERLYSEREKLFSF
ncbi:MAG: ATP-dependent DNA helicase RecG [Candidatus Cloacimonetes bacterium]|nr:ATP-dependent DNA helicase RecG [Candidatus Cloacimonadota bacterium]